MPTCTEGVTALRVVVMRFAPLLGLVAACASEGPQAALSPLPPPEPPITVTATTAQEAGAPVQDAALIDAPLASSVASVSLDCGRLERPIHEAQAARDVAGSALATAPGSTRRALDGWLARSGPARSEGLRVAVVGGTGELADAARDASAALDALGARARRSDSYVDEYGSLARALDHVTMSCPESGPPRTGRLEAEALQVIIRTSFGTFRKCYDAALASQPSLAGRVTTKFVINVDGVVESPTDFGSDLPDRKVVSCVVDGFRSLHFAAPRGGILKVVYPIVFTPG
jgi:hypothetical protein